MFFTCFFSNIFLTFYDVFFSISKVSGKYNFQICSCLYPLICLEAGVRNEIDGTNMNDEKSNGYLNNVDSVQTAFSSMFVPSTIETVDTNEVVHVVIGTSEEDSMTQSKLETQNEPDQGSVK